MKNLPRFALAIGGACLASLLLTTACIVTVHTIDGVVDSGREQASRDEVRELHLTAGQTLWAETPYGHVTVHSVSGTGACSLRATVTTRGRDVAEAQARLAHVRLVVDESSDGARLRLDVDPEAKSTYGGGPSVDYDVDVPAGVRLQLTSSSGDVRAERGPFGASTLKSSYGSVSIDGVDGDVTAESKSGNVAVSHVARGAVTASSGYGDVSITDVAGSDVRAHSGSGSLTIARVQGRRLDADSGYGNVGLADVKVETDAKASSKSGDVRAARVVAATTQLSSGYGKVAVDDAEGSLTLTTKSGDISAKSVRSAVAAKTGYGSVSLDGVFTTLAASSSSGDVRVQARAQSTVRDGWKLSSKYGAVALTAPGDMAFELAAKTGYGSIDVGYPMEIQPGTLGKDQKQIRGRVNGGGGTVQVETGSGNVAVKPESH